MPKEVEQSGECPAPIWRRIAAIIYDSFLVLAITFLVGFINLGIQMKIHGAEQLKALTESGQSIGGPVFSIALFLCVFSFFAYCWTRQGQTLGMKAWRLQIKNDDGSMMSMGQCLIRTLVALPALLGGIGLIWCLFDNEKMSLQDRVSRSRTLYNKNK